MLGHRESGNRRKRFPAVHLSSSNSATMASSSSSSAINRATNPPNSVEQSENSCLSEIRSHTSIWHNDFHNLSQDIFDDIRL
ncbi:unnamed protein product [Dracunculus medinensis]|uniref:Uncharacterized protein n=1 Tax=Dracunculus medinensis TaxID=318479 RepID=A0A0N4U0Z5_DRAME|nr:unnamed protein product [Dracunculus medinensis]